MAAAVIGEQLRFGRDGEVTPAVAEVGSGPRFDAGDHPGHHVRAGGRAGVERAIKRCFEGCAIARPPERIAQANDVVVEVAARGEAQVVSADRSGP